MSEGSRYQWVLVTDTLSPNTSDRVLKVGPRSAVGRAGIRTTVLEGEHFRMLDRHGRECYTGYISGRYSGLEPLDDFGRDHGCVDIQYERNGVWVEAGGRRLQDRGPAPGQGFKRLGLLPK